MIKKKNFLNYCGLLGVAAFLSYTAAVVFSPLAYPGYDWMVQAVSDMNAVLIWVKDVKRVFDEKDTLQNASAVHLADVLLQNMELGKYIDNAGEINIHRDKMMADILW